MATMGAVTVHKVKTVVLGDCAVGKTSIALRYAKGEFDPLHKHTLAGRYFSNLYG